MPVCTARRFKWSVGGLSLMTLSSLSHPLTFPLNFVRSLAPVENMICCSRRPIPLTLCLGFVYYGPASVVQPPPTTQASRRKVALPLKKKKYILYKGLKSLIYQHDVLPKLFISDAIVGTFYRRDVIRPTKYGTYKRGVYIFYTKIVVMRHSNIRTQLYIPLVPYFH